MLWMPKVQIIAPSTIRPTRRRVRPSSRRRPRPAALVLRLRDIKNSSCIFLWFLYTISIRDIVTIVSRGRGMEKKENLFSIGEVAKYQNISKQTLIFYDKAGVFRPAWVDPANG